jgi:hypothetical protein
MTNYLVNYLAFQRSIKFYSLLILLYSTSYNPRLGFDPKNEVFNNQMMCIDYHTGFLKEGARGIFDHERSTENDTNSTPTFLSILCVESFRLNQKQYLY